MNNPRKRVIVWILCSCLILASHAAFGAKPFQVDGNKYVPVGQNPSTNYMIRLKLGPPKTSDTQKRFSVLFGADRQGNGYRFETEGEDWKLLHVADQEPTVLAEGKQNALPSSDPVDVRIKSHPWLLSLIVNGKVFVELNDASVGSGLVAVDPGVSSPAADPVVQPITPVEFAESFMRTEDELKLDESKIWTTETGKWQLHFVEENVDNVNLSRVPDRKKPDRGRSANPFSISGYAKKRGLIWAGSWLWDDYSATTSVRNNGAKAVGLAFNIRSKENYFVLRWENNTSVMKPTPIELVRVAGGEKERLKRVWVDGQLEEWFELGVRTTGTRVQAFLDGAEIIDLHHAAGTGGGVGLYVEGGDEKNQADFDDVKVTTIERLEFTDPIWLAEHARRRSGEWRLERVDRRGRPAMRCPSLQSADGRMILGNQRWAAPVVSANVSVPEGNSEIGFTAGGQDAKDAAAYRVVLGRSGKRLKLSISRRESGKTVRLAGCSDVPVPDNEVVRLEADFTRGDEIQVRVNGKLELRTRRKHDASGAIQLFGQNAEGVTFRNLTVAFERSDDQARLPAEQSFREDPYMKHWSSPQGRWWPVNEDEDAEAFWHVGDFYGRSDIVVPPQDKLLLIHAAEEMSPESGYALVMEKKDEEKKTVYDLKLLREGKKVAEGIVTSKKMPEKGVTLHKEDRYLWVTADGQQIWSYRDPNPLSGTRVALKGVDADQLGEVKIHRYQVRDYYFEVSPTDWISGGRWEVTNRFTCDPRWSHMAAITSSAGALFSKLKYRGDLTLEAFMGMRMRRGNPRYPRVGDLNMAMTTRPYALDTGYRFVLGGWDRYWSDRDTYLLKDDKRLASTRKRLLPSRRWPGQKDRVFDVPWIKGGRNIHGAWYYLKARKQDGRLEYYVDNNKVYEVLDPNPYREIYPAIWTYNAAVMVARVRVSYEQKIVPGKLVEPPEKDQVEESKDAPEMKLVSSTHPGLMDDFENDANGWEIFNAEHGGYPQVVPRQDGGKCLKVTNREGGGKFAVKRSVKDLKIDANRVFRLNFDYRIPPESKINLYIMTEKKKYYVHLTGPDFPDALTYKIGDINIEADGQWHHATVELGAMLQERFGAVENGQITRIVLGNLHRGLLESGLTGNPKNASFSVDNFLVSSINGKDFRGELKVESGEIDRVLVAYDSNPHTRPESEGKLSNPDLEPGRWFCHVRAQLKRKKDKVWTPTLHLPLAQAPSSPQVISTAPEPNGQWGYGPVIFELAEGQSMLLDDAKFDVAVNGVPLEGSAQSVNVDYAENAVVVSLARSGLKLPEGKAVRMKLTYGDEGTKKWTHETTLMPSRTADHTPPTVPQLTDIPDPDDFENDVGGWEAKNRTAIVRDETTSAAGDASLMIQSEKYGGQVAAYPERTQFNLGHFPVVEFDYRIPDVMRIDLALHNNVATCLFGLTERAEDKKRYEYLGHLPGVQADGEWQHMRANLLDRVKQLDYKNGLYEVDFLKFGNFGFRKSAPGSYYHIDNFRRVPLMSRHLQNDMEVRAYDAAGIKGYSFVWSEREEQIPDETIDEAEPTTLPENLPAPYLYLHVRACDRAGNWGPAAHFPFLIDLEPPKIASMSPANNTKSGSSMVSFKLQDDGSAVDPRTFNAKINGQEYDFTHSGVQYNPASGQFKWDWRHAATNTKSIPDGHEITARVTASDFGENAISPVEWSWTMDYARDKRPPAMADANPTTMPVRTLANFEKGRNNWVRVTGHRYGAKIKHVERKKGGHCLKIAAKNHRSYLNVRAYRKSYDLKKYPLVSFEYRIANNTYFNMAMKLNGRWHELQITSPGRKWKKLGELKGIKTDKKWHHVVINLLDFARKKYPKKEKFNVKRIRFTDRKRRNKRKSHWFVDNFMISGYGTPEAQFKWKSRDITGIAGFAAAFVDSSEADLPDKITHKKSRGQFKLEKSGTHWLKVKARDNGGNWGTVTTVPYLIENQENTGKEKEKTSGDQKKKK